MIQQLQAPAALHLTAPERVQGGLRREEAQEGRLTLEDRGRRLAVENGRRAGAAGRPGAEIGPLGLFRNPFPFRLLPLKVGPTTASSRSRSSGMVMRTDTFTSLILPLAFTLIGEEIGKPSTPAGSGICRFRFPLENVLTFASASASEIARSSGAIRTAPSETVRFPRTMLAHYPAWVGWR